MNILYTNFHFGKGGGHTTYILSLLENTEHTAYVACAARSHLYQTLRERGFPRLIPIEFYAKPKHFRQVIKNSRLLKKAVEEHAIDIIHTNGSPDNRMALYVTLFSRKKCKIVYTKHNCLPVRGWFSQLRFRKFNDAVIFVSEHARQAAGFTDWQANFHVVEHGINLDYWKRGKPPVSGNSRIRLISTAGSVRAKGWIHLAEAIALLPEADQRRLSAVVLGRYEPVMEEMQQRARELCGMEFPGFFTDTRPWLEDADIAFNLSYSEALSFAQREMMSMSLPIIVSDVPILRQNIDPGCGWVTKKRDAESVARALREILALPAEKLQAMKLAARRKAEESFSMEQTIAATNKIYAGLFA